MKVARRNAWISALLLIVTFLALTSTSLINTAAITINPTFTFTHIQGLFDFEISASPTEQSVFVGTGGCLNCQYFPVTFKVTVKLISGTPEPVNLNLLAPSFLTYSFSPYTVTATETVTPTVILRVDESPDLKGYSIVVPFHTQLTISGTGAGLTRSTTVTLTLWA